MAASLPDNDSTGNATNNSASMILTPIFRRMASVELLDESHGLFGELLPPELVWEGLHQNHDNVGSLNHPGTVAARHATQSLAATPSLEVCIEFENATALPLTIRWLDEYGRTFDHYNFVLEAFDTAVRYTRVGHLFVLSVMDHDNRNNTDNSIGGNDNNTAFQMEALLGAYRVRMPLPSNSPHYLRLEQTGSAPSSSGPGDDSGETNNTTATFLLEAMLADPTIQDQLVVTAEALDTLQAGAGPHRIQLAKTVQALHTILHNLREHPPLNKDNNDINSKFHSLRLSNPKVQHTIASNPNAMHLLHMVGFRVTTTTSSQEGETSVNNIKSEDIKKSSQEDLYLTWTVDPHDYESQKHKLDKAYELLELLKARAQPNFVAELAQSPPWQGPILMSLNGTVTGGGRSDFHTGGTRFLSDDEKWARAERNGKRRSAGGRRPTPGNAPSSNGKWGR